MTKPIKKAISTLFLLILVFSAFGISSKEIQVLKPIVSNGKLIVGSNTIITIRVKINSIIDKTMSVYANKTRLLPLSGNTFENQVNLAFAKEVSIKVYDRKLKVLAERKFPIGTEADKPAVGTTGPVITIIKPQLDEGQRTITYSSHSKIFELEYEIESQYPIKKINGSMLWGSDQKKKISLKDKVQLKNGENKVVLSAVDSQQNETSITLIINFEDLELVEKEKKQQDEVKAYENALALDTFEAWDKFLDDYPNAEFNRYSQANARWSELRRDEYNQQVEEKLSALFDRVKQKVAVLHDDSEYTQTLSNVSNPFHFKKEEAYYFVTFSPAQWLDDKTCLGRAVTGYSYGSLEYSDYFYVDLGGYSAGFLKQVEKSCVFLCEGTYEYVTVLGEKKVVPRFKLIDKAE